jgi:hypothetical protein
MHVYRFLFTHSLLAVILCLCFQAIREASVHVYKSAGDIVQDAMDEVIADNDFNLPNPTYVERSVNRFRQTPLSNRMDVVYFKFIHYYNNMYVS